MNTITKVIIGIIIVSSIFTFNYFISSHTNEVIVNNTATYEVVNNTATYEVVNITTIIDVIPTYNPILREYKIDKSNDIWKAQNPKSYIEPNNEWVKYYANKVFIDENGIVLYKEKKPYPVIGYTSFTNTYIDDNTYHHYPPNADYWQNADYYLTHNQTGDCEDFAIALVSMMRSGEISDQNGTKIIIRAELVSGYYTKNKIRHTWVEYNFNNETYIAHSLGNIKNLDNSIEFSITEYTNNTSEFIPIFRYN